MEPQLCHTCDGLGTIYGDEAPYGCQECRGLGYVIPTDPTNADLDAIVAARQPVTEAA